MGWVGIGSPGLRFLVLGLRVRRATINSKMASLNQEYLHEGYYR